MQYYRYLLALLSLNALCAASQIGSMSEAVREELLKLTRIGQPADDYDTGESQPHTAASLMS